MPLELDHRQRAMLQEMGVQVWLPGTAFAPQDRVTALAATAPAIAGRAGAVAPAVPVSAFIPGVPAVPAVPAVPVASRATAAPAIARQPSQGMPAPVPMGELSHLDWQALADTAAGCQACGLCAGRKHSMLQVPAASARADWMVVGDPPDEEEDRAGQPFVDSTGLLLDNMLKAVGVGRISLAGVAGVGGEGSTASAGAYLSNVVKCRPPQGRIPQAAELAQCAHYLQREIALVQPKVILAMGRFAIQLLLSEQAALAALPLGKLRGTVYRYQGTAVVVTYHPKVLLRASADKGKAWADLCLAADVVQSVSTHP